MESSTGSLTFTEHEISAMLTYGTPTGWLIHYIYLVSVCSSYATWAGVKRLDLFCSNINLPRIIYAIANNAQLQQIHGTGGQQMKMRSESFLAFSSTWEFLKSQKFLIYGEKEIKIHLLIPSLPTCHLIDTKTYGVISMSLSLLSSPPSPRLKRKKKSFLQRHWKTLVVEMEPLLSNFRPAS